MRRREFLTVIGSAAAAGAWPLRLSAQQTMPVIGLLHSGTAVAFAEQVAAFRQSLREGGYAEAQNIAIEYRWAEGRFDRLPALAADLARRQVAVIVAFGGNNSALAAKAATTTIPIVFLTGADPLQSGLVTSLNRPDGNVTGVSFFVEELGAKALGLLHELVPGANAVGLLINSNNPEVKRQSAATQEAARTLGLQLYIVDAATADAVDKAFDVLVERRLGALLVSADPFFGDRIAQLIALTARNRIPTMYYRREYVEAGGLASYGTSVNDAYHQVGGYVARILKGAKPSDLPVMQPTRFEFVINLKTAKILGIEVSPGLSARADDVIE